jgi:hypothetical protein
LNSFKIFDKAPNSDVNFSGKKDFYKESREFDLRPFICPLKAKYNDISTMKNHLTVVLFLVATSTFAGNPYVLEESEIDFSEINQVEALVMQNPELTFQEIENYSPQLLENFDTAAKISASAAFMDSDTGIPPFWWGFCLGIWGIIIVLIITDKDKDSINKAFRGCLVSGLTAIAIYGLVVLILAAGAASITAGL